MSGELPATYYIHHICKILIYHIWEKSVLHVETKSNIKIVSWKCSVSHTTSYRAVTYPWELLKHSRKNSLRESKVPRVLWLLASTKSNRFWTNHEAFLQSPGCSFSWFLEIADVWKTLWAGRLKLNTGLWSTGISLLQEKLLRKFTKWESWPIFRAFCSKIMHELWSIFLRTPSLVKNFPIVSWGIWLVEAWWETPHARIKSHVGTTKLTDCKLHKYFHTYLSYLSFILSLLYLCSELPFSSRATVLHWKRQRFAATIAVNFVTVLSWVWRNITKDCNSRVAKDYKYETTRKSIEINTNITYSTSIEYFYRLKRRKQRHTRWKYYALLTPFPTPWHN